MFICGKCLRERFQNVGFAQSYGNCESCGQTSSCYDIPSKALILKPRHIEALERKCDDGLTRIYTNNLPEGYYWQHGFLVYNGEYVIDYDGEKISAGNV